MAEFSTKRIVLVAALASAVVAGAVAGGVAEALGAGTTATNRSSAADRASVATVRVERTNLQSTVQVGGSINYRGSYVIAAPGGASAQQVAQAQQQLIQAQQAVAADQTARSDTTAADDQAVAAARNGAAAASSTLSTDQARTARDCAGRASVSPSCDQDTQKATQDRVQLIQARQQVSTAQLNAVRDDHQARAKVRADAAQLGAAVTNVADLQPTAVNPATTYTSLPKVGDVIRMNEPVYALNGQPVPLLYGSVAAYRAFYVGMSDGADVGELTHDLIALGYGAGLHENDHYSSATAAAVTRWQAASGLPSTGTLLLGQVTFEPGPIRVTSVSAAVGQTISGNGSTVLNATSTTPIVTVSLAVTQEYLVKPGDAVTVVLPDGTSTVRGHVETVGHVATCPNGNGNGAGNGSPNANNGSADQSPCAANGTSSTPTITVTIALDAVPTAATLDQAPVNVNVTTQRADNVLAVPVNALLALQGGGDAVEVVDGTAHHLVGVTTGLYSDTMVQISGAGIAPGTLVEVPSP
ncbi:MAG TPA: peptidoglycan-binding domain-containing protein [Acidimicrobiia bacterium]|nr:peptidoglycan-binding domain-containing protein [Acidimicrobiia bacterium]